MLLTRLSTQYHYNKFLNHCIIRHKYSSYHTTKMVPVQSPNTQYTYQDRSKLSQIDDNDILATPLTIGNITLKNRIVMASLTRNRAFRTVQDELNADYYSDRASAGLILCEGTLISPQGTEWPEAPGLYNTAHVTGWKKVTDAVHRNGGLIFAQLWHVGRVTHPLHQTGLPPIGPSAVRANGGKFRLLIDTPGYVEPVAIANPAEITAQYKRAAELAKQADFDGVEIHSANGYLPHQFLDSNANQRTDEYGGTPEKRCKFTLDAIDAAISVYGADRVGIKLSPSGGFNDVGDDEDTTYKQYTYLLQQLSDRRIAYVQLMGHLQAFDPTKRGTTIDTAKLGKSFTTGAVFLNGEFDAEKARQAIKHGDADAIVFGRPFVANPDAAEKLIRGESTVSAMDSMKTWYEYDGYPYDHSKRSDGYTSFKRKYELKH